MPIVDAMREYGSKWLGAAETCEEAAAAAFLAAVPAAS